MELYLLPYYVYGYSKPQMPAKAVIYLFTFVVALASPVFPATANEDCHANKSGLYAKVAKRIEASEISILSKISCAEINQINTYDPGRVEMTSGRRSGKYIVCLSDNRDNPCKHNIATLTGFSSPGAMIFQVFGLERPKQTTLNETVERLFFKPSALID